jgi:NADH-quinone oxidoreductase subunit C
VADDDVESTDAVTVAVDDGAGDGVPDAGEPAPAVDPVLQAWVERVLAELGDAVVAHELVYGRLTVRIRPDAWRRTAEVARQRLGCDYLSFVAGIDWMPAPKVGGDDASGDTSAPVQPMDQTYGATGSDGRFQVFASVVSTQRKHTLVLKTDVGEAEPIAQSWAPVYPGADWHERETWEMYGIRFDGHPGLRHIYLPGEFEGYPGRKDFPLLAREVKPWPGLVDVEPMPGDDAAAEEES